MSSCIAYGFFPLAGGSRLSTYNSSNGRTIFHCHYTTSIKTATGDDIPAKIRVYCSPSDNPLPNDTLAFAVAKVSAPAGQAAIIDLDSIAFYAVPGDIRSETYQDNIPDFATFIFGVGHVPQASQSSPVLAGAKSFTLAMAEYVGGGMKQFNLLLLYPATNRWTNTPVPQPLSCTQFVGFFAGRSSEGIVQITIEHIALNLSPHTIAQATATAPVTPRRKYAVMSAALTPTQPLASTSKNTLPSAGPVNTHGTRTAKRKRGARPSPPPEDSQAEEDDEEIEDEEVLGKGKRKKKARTMA
ncbi:hypothetical protein C8F01DRAFT_1138439 [Mycena amicta]|nr:hypothetical protein C8F01DRAFT_1138439 [Mycena amicta]